ncbi:YjbF family lipoprotein [Vibrio parahaemolyticus]
MKRTLTLKGCKALTLTTLLITSTGCTQKFSDVSATVQEAYSNYIDVELSADEIRDVPYSSAYLKIGSQKQVFVVLAFAEKNPKTGITQLKWVSADNAMIVTENGRIVKTLGLQANNLAGLHGQIPKYDITQENKVKFESVYDWTPNYLYSFPAEIIRTKLHQEIVTTPLNTTKTTVFNEKVMFPTLNSEFNNTYWVTSSGQVKKSLQYLGPNMAPIEFVVLKGYAKK